MNNEKNVKKQRLIHAMGLGEYLKIQIENIEKAKKRQLNITYIVIGLYFAIIGLFVNALEQLQNMTKTCCLLLPLFIFILIIAIFSIFMQCNTTNALEKARKNTYDYSKSKEACCYLTMHIVMISISALLSIFIIYNILNVGLAIWCAYLLIIVFIFIVGLIIGCCICMCLSKEKQD